MVYTVYSIFIHIVVKDRVERSCLTKYCVCVCNLRNRYVCMSVPCACKTHLFHLFKKYYNQSIQATHTALLMNHALSCLVLE